MINTHAIYAFKEYIVYIYKERQKEKEQQKKLNNNGDNNNNRGLQEVNFLFFFLVFFLRLKLKFEIMKNALNIIIQKIIVTKPTRYSQTCILSFLDI